MKEAVFDKTLENSNNKRLQTLDFYEEPVQTFEMNPMQAAFVEKQLNSKRDKNHHRGFMLVPIRREDQTLYKAGMKEEEARTFLEEEEMTLLQFYKDLSSIKNKISQQQFHYFLTLEQLRRHPLSRYFMALPDPIFLKLYDFSSVISQPLDIRQIANKVLKRKYQNNDDFEVDMVAMIQNYRIYFLKDTEMFDISIKFEILFWDVYQNEEQANKEAMDTFKYYKNRCKRARGPRKTTTIYTEGQKKELVQHFNSLAVDVKKKIIFCLEVGPLKNKKIANSAGKEAVNLKNMKDDFYVELEELLKGETEKSSKRRNPSTKKVEGRLKQPKQLKKLMREGPIDLQEQLYFSDESEDNDQRKKEVKVSREAVQEVLDMISMEQAIFGSDDDD